MHHDVDTLLVRLAKQPLPDRLGGLEAEVRRDLAGGRAPMAEPSWRYAALCLALVAGVGVGGGAATLSQTPALAADLSGVARLAPSSLLDASE